MKTLENKIRESLPRLVEIGVGLEFIDELGFKAKIVFEDFGTYYYFSYSDNEIFSAPSHFFGGICKEIIGHPIQLNDVLEYYKNSNFQGGTNYMLEGVWEEGCFQIVDNWDLSSPFLTYQSCELKEFLNNL